MGLVARIIYAKDIEIRTTMEKVSYIHDNPNQQWCRVLIKSKGILLEHYPR
jgi:hypothetical protein